MQYLYQRSQTGTSANCQGNKAADTGETANRYQGIHHTDFSGQEDPPKDNVALFGGAHVHKAL